MNRGNLSRESTWIGARPTPAATALLLTIGATYLVLLFLEPPLAHWIVSHFGLLPGQALGPRPWQLLTSTLIRTHFGTVIGDGFAVWIFATAVEMRTGARRMLLIAAAGQILGALVTAGVGRLGNPALIFEGSNQASLALAMAFGVLYGHTPLRLFGLAQMKSATLAWLVVGASLLVSLLNRDWPGFAGDAMGALTGWAMVSGVHTQITARWQRFYAQRRKRRYQVISGGKNSQRYLN